MWREGVREGGKGGHGGDRRKIRCVVRYEGREGRKVGGIKRIYITGVVWQGGWIVMRGPFAVEGMGTSYYSFILPIPPPPFFPSLISKVFLFPFLLAQ